MIAAAFCPRYSSSRNYPIQQRQIQQVEHKSSCQHEMTDMEMGDMQMEGTSRRLRPILLFMARDVSRILTTSIWQRRTSSVRRKAFQLMNIFKASPILRSMPLAMLREPPGCR